MSRKTVRKSAELTEVHLAYGLLPEELAGDGAVLTIVDIDAARQAMRAAACSTWGEFATVCDFGWSAFEKRFGHFLTEANGGEMPTACSAFAYAEFAGATLLLGEAAYWIGRIIGDPREVALDQLRTSSKKWPDLLDRLGLEYSLGSPDGHISAIEGKDPAAFEELPMAFRSVGGPRVQISREDDLVRNCLVLPFPSQSEDVLEN